jgi:hypothetical protein
MMARLMKDYEVAVFGEEKNLNGSGDERARKG